MKKISLLLALLSLAGAGCMESSTPPSPSPIAPPSPAVSAPAATTPAPSVVTSGTTENSITHPTTIDPSALPAALGSNGLTTPSQPAGDDVTIADVVAAKPGFVAVFDDLRGKPGELVGVSSYLNAGETRNVPIRLKTASKSGATYYATLYVDDGDKTFSLTKDKASRADNRAEATISFNIK